jgi:hypothetical protein
MLGARVEIVITKGKVLWRRARTDGSYLSANDPRILVGLGNVVGVEMVRVHWPDASITDHKRPAIDQYNVLKGGVR